MGAALLEPGGVREISPYRFSHGITVVEYEKRHAHDIQIEILRRKILAEQELVLPPFQYLPQGSDDLDACGIDGFPKGRGDMPAAAPVFLDDQGRVSLVYLDSVECRMDEITQRLYGRRTFVPICRLDAELRVSIFQGGSEQSFLALKIIIYRLLV